MKASNNFLLVFHQPELWFRSLKCLVKKVLKSQCSLKFPSFIQKKFLTQKLFPPLLLEKSPSTNQFSRAFIENRRIMPLELRFRWCLKNYDYVDDTLRTTDFHMLPQEHGTMRICGTEGWKLKFSPRFQFNLFLNQNDKLALIAFWNHSIL